MNVLFIGLGSIGQRHLRNLNKVYGKINVFAIRKKFTTPTLNHRNQIETKTNLKEKYKLKYFKNKAEALRSKVKFDAAFVCTPTSHHMNDTLWCIRNDINVFVEKPLSNSTKKLDKLKKLISKKKLIHMMGFQLRFNPIINFLQKLFNKKSNKIGKINFVNIHHGESLKDFHPYEDYRISYASRKLLGGDIALNQIHEIDYFLELFKKYKIIKKKAEFKQVSNYEIDINDTFNGIFYMKKSNNSFVCHIHLNHYEKPKKRTIDIICDNGKLFVDLNRQEVQIYTGSKKKTIKFKYKKDDVFKSELKYFIKCIKNKTKIPQNLNINNGIKTLEFINSLK